MLCPKCNQSVGENDAFCSNCGCSLAEARQKEKVAASGSFAADTIAVNTPMQGASVKRHKADETLAERFFNADGRLNRKPYIIRLLTLYLIAFCIEFFAIAAGLDVTAGPAIKGILFIFVGIPGVMLMIRRLHDLNRSGWLWIFSLIPFINLALLGYVIFFKGTTGPNRFGPDPLE